MSSFKNPNLPALYVNETTYQLRQYDKDLLFHLNELVRNLDAILNRGIRFQDNVDCRQVSFSSSATPNAENTVAHTLGKVPTGYFVYSKDKAAHLYDGGTTWTKTNIYIKSDVASVAFKMIVF